MKSFVNIVTVLLLLFIGAACKKEGTLSPSPEKEQVYSEYSLPQGNHAYDADIVQLFQKYNTLFLYKYAPHDLYAQGNEYTGGTYDAAKDSTTWYGYFDVPANENFVGQQLDLLKNTWLRFYPDNMLKAMLPKEVFLLDSFFYAYNGPGKPVDNWPTFYDTYQGNDFFAVAWGGSRITAMTAAKKYALKSTLNTMFLTTARKKGLIRRSTAFSAVSNYAAVTYTNYLQQGVIDFYSRSPDTDWDAFMTMIVSNTYSDLTAPGGFLNPGVDTSGLIRKKYDLMIAWFKSVWGVDLQAIGNAI